MTKALAQAMTLVAQKTATKAQSVTPLTEKVGSINTIQIDVTSGSLGKKNKTHMIVPPTGKQRSLTTLPII